MRLKRFALRALIGLFVAVALCMFFARTVQTITTPKIQLVTASSGRFEEVMTFQARVHFPEEEEITLEEAEDTPVTVGKIYVKPGHYVKKGEILFTASAPSYEEDMEKLREEYAAKSKELLDLDATNRKLSKESRQNELYDEMIQAQEEMTELVCDARFLALDEDITLSGDVNAWTQELAIHAEVSQEVRDLVAKAQTASAAYESARAAYFEILDNRKLRVKDEVFDYILKRGTLLEEMEELNGDMVALASSVGSLREVKAPHDGFVISIDVTEGASYDGSKAAYTISAEGVQPVLRAPLDKDERAIADGTRADVNSEVYGAERTSVEQTVVNVDGSKELQIPIPEAYLSEESAAIRRFVSDGGVEVKITYRARQSTTLLPPSCVRDAGDSSYVYLIEQEWGGFMSQSSMKVKKTTVTVLDRSDSAVSVAEDLSYQQIADREDRALEDGQTVMEYVQ